MKARFGKFSFRRQNADGSQESGEGFGASVEDLNWKTVMAAGGLVILCAGVVLMIPPVGTVAVAAAKGLGLKAAASKVAAANAAKVAALIA